MSQNRPNPPGRGPGDRTPSRGPIPGMNMGCARWLLPMWILLAVAAFAWTFGLFDRGGVEAQEIAYSEFREQVADGNVEAVRIENQRIEGELRSPATVVTEDGTTVQYTNLVTHAPPFGDDTLLPLLEEQGVTVRVEPPDTGLAWWPILLNLLPLALLLVVGYTFLRRSQAQGQNLFSFGESRAKRYTGATQATTFGDVAGAYGAKEELQEVIDFLKNPTRFERIGAQVPKGVLLVGPPGTGKTLLARAVAGEAGAPFFSITGSDFMEMFVGVGASRVRNLFEEAKRSAPAIIFIDELDSIGRRRGAGLGGGHDEREQTLNQLLSEMDGFEPNIGVIVMAATNRPDILDSALLRPGRFDRQIAVDLPTMGERLEILKIHARNKPLEEEVDLERVARGTPGFSGADLANLLNEAALLAARDRRERIVAADVDDARDKVLMGLQRGDLGLTQEELQLLAYHEGGHTVVAAALPHTDPIHKVTIVPRGHAMGATQQLPTRDRYVYPWEYMIDRLAVMMGGRAAERLVLNTATSGAEGDLKGATQLARKMVLDWGVTESLGPVALGSNDSPVFLGEEIGRGRDYSDETAREVDEEVRHILEEAYRRAYTTLEEHREALDRLAEALLEREELTGEEVFDIIGLPPRSRPSLTGEEQDAAAEDVRSRVAGE